jgi:hypothetical protein
MLQHVDPLKNRRPIIVKEKHEPLSVTLQGITKRVQEEQKSAYVIEQIRIIKRHCFRVARNGENHFVYEHHKSKKLETFFEHEKLDFKFTYSCDCYEEMSFKTCYCDTGVYLLNW